MDIKPSDYHWMQVEDFLREQVALIGALDDYRHTFAGRIGGLRFQEARAEVALLSAAQKTAVDAAIEWLVVEGKPPTDLSEDAKYWLVMRMEAAICFVGALSTPGDDGCIGVFPPSRLSSAETIRYLLQGWWSAHGIDHVVFYLASSLVFDLSEGDG